MNREDTSGFFVFDFYEMDVDYKSKAFNAIYECLKDAAGVCAFYDDNISPETVRELAEQSNLLESNSFLERDLSPLNNLQDSFQLNTYLCGMWTDNHDNFDKIHTFLELQEWPEYLGYFTFEGAYIFSAFTEFVTKQLELRAGLVFTNGEIESGTSKHGIGVSNEDTALLNAVIHNDYDLVVETINNGANVNCIDPFDRVSTPLMRAVVGGNVRIVKCLIKFDANPNTDNLSNTVLMLAARHGYTKIVEILLETGADVNACDSNGATAMDSAENYLEIKNILKAAGGVGKGQ